MAVVGLALYLPSFGLLAWSLGRAVTWWLRREPGSYAKGGLGIGAFGLGTFTLLAPASAYVLAWVNDAPREQWEQLTWLLFLATVVNAFGLLVLHYEFGTPFAELSYLAELRRFRRVAVRLTGASPPPVHGAENAERYVASLELDAAGQAEIEAAWRRLRGAEATFVDKRYWRDEH